MGRPPSPQTGVLLDARAAERFRGEVEPIDPRAGHIPGAVSAPDHRQPRQPTAGCCPPPQLADRFAALGVATDAPVGVYCGSGVTAAHEALALDLAGFDASLYPGSWSAWSNDPIDRARSRRGRLNRRDTHPVTDPSTAGRRGAVIVGNSRVTPRRVARLCLHDRYRSPPDGAPDALPADEVLDSVAALVGNTPVVELNALTRGLPGRACSSSSRAATRAARPKTASRST